MNLKKKKEISETWAIIPARSNSKSIKNKNLKKIKNKNLLQLSIEVSKKTKLINRTFVSTNSKSILYKSIKYGSEKINLRNAKNSKDFSTDIDVIKDFLQSWLRKNNYYPKYIIYLRPTTPFRSKDILNNAIKKFKKLKNYDSMISVNKILTVYKTFNINNYLLKTNFKKMSLDDANLPRQKFNDTYVGNGYFDIIKTKNLFKNFFLGKKCYPYVLKETIDIDGKKDLIIAQIIFKNKKKFNKYFQF